MGWFGNILSESESKIFSPLIDSLGQVSPTVRVEKAEIGCSKQIGHMHIGLEIWFPDNEKIDLHRCMNRWIYTDNSIGLNPREFFLQFTSPQEADELLSKLILDMLKAKQSGQGSEETDPAAIDETGDEIEVQETIEIGTVIDKLSELYLSSGLTTDPAVAAEVAGEYSKKWKERVEKEIGVEGNEKIGTILEQGSVPQTRHGRATLQQMKLRSKKLSKSC